ncbi:hypothetical protein GALMADRAFT_270157 [Galerina marginata CBS 339.88]|uniref:Uncharacterized protein n=1 Tax=Galerina marginata (strain CBS 339.88) TaxID=685588 RepID=A0A067T2S6_GALM3|nr:hypothetical protein GALMADRAFT_270157 [Galerina marginata CBS 339.88]
MVDVEDLPGKDIWGSFSPGHRFVGDSKCWTLTILPALALPKSTMDANSWTLLDDWSDLQMQYSLLSSSRLRFSYLIMDEPLQNSHRGRSTNY